MDMSLELFSFANGMSSISPRRQTNETLYVKDVPIKAAKIVLMNHPASVTAYKYVSVEVLSGSVSVLGYEITPKSEAFEIFSSEKTGLIEIKTETFERIWKKKEDSSILEQQIYHITDDRKTTTEILRKFGNSTVAICIKRCPFPLNVELLDLYYPIALEFKLFKKHDEEFVFKSSVEEAQPIQFHVEHEELASEINVLIRSAKLTESDAPRVLVIGPRNSGKTTLLRFLVNKILSVYRGAYYLDTDPGQSEFTPPGVVSLVKVKKPIVGPPFCHQQKPIKMMFTGSTSPSFLEMYIRGISSLMQLYAEKYANNPLFVNTIGWMEGTGLQCLIKTIETVQPTVLIEITTPDEVSMFDYREYLPANSKYFQVSCRHKHKQAAFSGRDMRNFSLISYLGKCQNELYGLRTLNEMKPFCVKWDKVAIYICPDGNVHHSRMIEAINESIVALCAVPDSAILESDVPEWPKTLESDPEHECVGYGLVQAIDEKAHILYIISPLKSNDWNKVNAIIKGKIAVPDALILNEEIYGEPLPYTDEREVVPPGDGDDDDDTKMMDISMVSSAFETDSPASKSFTHGSVTQYRKKIPPRYRRFIRK